MVATMRELGLPLDYQVEDTTVVVTATLGPDTAEALDPGDAALSARGRAGN
jgi:hypothetical protein